MRTLREAIPALGRKLRVYGARKVWRQLRREGYDVASCTIERLMREMGLRPSGVGRATRTSTSVDTDPRPLDLVLGASKPPGRIRLGVADFFPMARSWTGFVMSLHRWTCSLGCSCLGWRVSNVL
jgi:transposase InsO family protein